MTIPINQSIWHAAYWATIACTLLAMGLMKTTIQNLFLKNKELITQGDHQEEVLRILLHDIRTPLANLESLYQKIALGLEPNSPIHDSLEEIAELQSFLDNQLSIYKSQDGLINLNLQPYCLKTIVLDRAKKLHHLAKKNDCTFQVYIDRSLAPSLLLDPHRIQQILNNILRNALQYQYHGQVELHVRVSAEDYSGQIIQFYCANGPDKIQLNVSPIRNDYQRFGLDICQRMIRLMGGDLEVNCHPSYGFNASFFIPALRSIHEPIQKRSMPSSKKEASTQQKVCIIDDHKLACAIMSHTLEELGFKTYAYQAITEEVLELIQNEPIQTMIMDLHPEQDLFSDIQHLKKKIGLTLFATSAQRPVSWLKLYDDFDGFLQKPFNGASFCEDLNLKTSYQEALNRLKNSGITMAVMYDELIRHHKNWACELIRHLDDIGENSEPILHLAHKAKTSALLLNDPLLERASHFSNRYEISSEGSHQLVNRLLRSARVIQSLQ